TWYPDTWWKPFEEANVGTIVFQLIIVFLIIPLMLRLKHKWRSSVVEEGMSESETYSNSTAQDIKEGM
ncbi:sodium-dependent transporter, partial [Alkalihalophilus pseudofirmus]|nr:sodium-dependent transporter [Alkalihalophilus pseudofirmus]